MLNPYDLGLEEGTSNFEVKHRFTANAIWQTAFGAPGSTTNKLFSGFTISPTLVMTSGSALYRRGHRQHADHRARPHRRARRRRHQPPAADRRNTYHLPKHRRRRPSRLARLHRLGTQKIEAILDVFNLTNRLNYTQVNSTMYAVGGTAAAPTLTYNQTFQTLTNANSNYFVFTPRQIQLAVRYTF